jgi:uncharacterized membrane protein
MTKRSTQPDAFFSADERSGIVAAIEKAERATSAEIKLIVLGRSRGDIKRTAAELFREHALDQTEQQNAVLILLVIANREFLIYGDEGIHQKAGQSFWDDVKETMQGYFCKDEFGTGLQAGIDRIGEKLKQYFPYVQGDINEIDNEIIHED